MAGTDIHGRAATSIDIQTQPATVGDSMKFYGRFTANPNHAYNVKVIGGIDDSTMLETTYDFIKAGREYLPLITWSATSPGTHKVWFELDPEHTAGDTDYSNNRIERTFSVDDGMFDLFFYSALKVHPDPVTDGADTRFDVTFTMKNGTVQNLKVAYGIDDNKIGEKSFANVGSNSLKEGKTHAYFNWIASPGSHKVWFELDPTHTTADTNHANNRVEKTFNVGAGALDLMFAKDIAFYPESKIGQDVRFSTLFALKGPPQDAVVVAYGVDDKKIGERTYTNIDEHSDAVALKTYISFNWIITKGSHKVWFEIDPAKQLGDTNYSNNRIEMEIHNRAVDFTPKGGLNIDRSKFHVK